MSDTLVFKKEEVNVYKWIFIITIVSIIVSLGMFYVVDITVKPECIRDSWKINKQLRGE